MNKLQIEIQKFIITLTDFENFFSGNPLQYSCPENPMDRGAW